MGLLRASTRLREVDRMWQLFVSVTFSNAFLHADKQGCIALHCRQAGSASDGTVPLIQAARSARPGRAAGTAQRSPGVP
jgi:hypothetical protein